MLSTDKKREQNKRIKIGNFFLYCPFCGNKIKLSKTHTSKIICSKCTKNLVDVFSQGKELDFCRSLHAEENAILSNLNTTVSNNNLTMYVTTFPCMLCAKKIVNSGIKKVVFVEPYPIEEAYNLLVTNDVEIQSFEGVKSWSFNWIFRKRAKYLKDTAISNLAKLESIKKGA